MEDRANYLIIITLNERGENLCVYLGSQQAFILAECPRASCQSTGCAHRYDTVIVRESSGALVERKVRPRDICVH